jgi:dodecin
VCKGERSAARAGASNNRERIAPQERLSVMVEKTIDLTGISANSVEDAVQIAISRAGVTIKGIHTAHIESIDALVEANKVVRWKVRIKVTFQVKDELHE